MNSLKTRRSYPVDADSMGQSRLRGHSEFIVQEFSSTTRVSEQLISAPTEMTQPSNRPSILIAEDDEDSRIMMRTLLELKGYRVIEANDGPKTIEAALEEEPLLLLLDLELPRLNGLEVARYLRRCQRTKGLAIVILSGHDPTKHREPALAAGCDSYLSKPIDFDRLEEILICYAPIGSKP